MADLGRSVGSPTWVAEIIAKRSFKIKYRGETRIKTKTGRVVHCSPECSKQRRENQAQGNILQASEQIKQGEAVGYSQSLRGYP